MICTFLIYVLLSVSSMEQEGHLMTSPTYLILGATGGMGQAVYERLSKRDASLLIGGRDPARLEALSKCTGTGALAGDARASLAVERAVARTVEHFGRIDGAVNLVGSLLLKPANLTKPEEWDDVIAANPGCAFPLVRAAAFAGATHEPTAQARPFRESGTASLRPVPSENPVRRRSRGTTSGKAMNSPSSRSCVALGSGASFWSAR
jgi:NAD(P)-dependent dehydrogenase (short-subunit alcohol dehydrogenase family)